MKKVLTSILLLLCSISYAQDGILPPGIESAFGIKYADARIADWWEENELFYLDFSSEGHSYIAVFDTKGSWIETAEIISELDIPVSMKAFIRKTFPTAKISHCEEVETAEMQKMIRANVIDTGGILRVICCDQEGRNIFIKDSAP